MAIEFSTRKFELSHGKSPRGRGAWAFAFDGKDNDRDLFWHMGLFVDAKRYARAWAVTKGYTLIEVMP
jgi:hypothetical protein